MFVIFAYDFIINILCLRRYTEQIARLLQTLCVIEYFAKSLKSLKVIRNDTVGYGVCKSLY